MVANARENPNFYQQPRLHFVGEVHSNVINFPVRKEPAPLDLSRYNEDVERIQRLQAEFERALGLSSEDIDLLGSYNPVPVRWRLEQLTSDEQIALFKNEEYKNILTNLKERYKTQKSTFRFNFDENNKLRSEFFPNEPFEDVIKRGIAYRSKAGSKELEREVAELKGASLVEEKFTDPTTPFNTKIVSFSRPGMVEDTPYTERFVDIFEKKRDSKTGVAYVEATRYSTNLLDEQYRQKACELRPDYFEECQGPEDAWYLAHPFELGEADINKTADEVFENHIGLLADGMNYEEFEEYIQKRADPFIRHQIEVICRKNFEPRNIALAHNTTLDIADEGNDILMKDRKLKKVKSPTPVAMRPYQVVDIQREVAIRGTREARTVAGGCGKNKGIKIGGTSEITNPVEKILANSVAQFGVSTVEIEKEIDYKFDEPGPCRECKAEVNTGPCKVCKPCDIKKRMEEKSKNMSFEELDLAE